MAETLEQLIEEMRSCRTRLAARQTDGPGDADAGLAAGIERLDDAIAVLAGTDRDLTADERAAGQREVVPDPPTPVYRIIDDQPGPDDDLTLIRGISRATAAALKTIGISRFAHLAGLTARDVAQLREDLGPRFTLAQHNWIEQAAILATGGSTQFSRRGAPNVALRDAVQRRDTPPPVAAVDPVVPPETPPETPEETPTIAAVDPAAPLPDAQSGAGAPMVAAMASIRGVVAGDDASAAPAGEVAPEAATEPEAPEAPVSLAEGTDADSPGVAATPPDIEAEPEPGSEPASEAENLLFARLPEPIVVLRRLPDGTIDTSRTATPSPQMAASDPPPAGETSTSNPAPVLETGSGTAPGVPHVDERGRREPVFGTTTPGVETVSADADEETVDELKVDASAGGNGRDDNPPETPRGGLLRNLIAATTGGKPAPPAPPAASAPVAPAPASDDETPARDAVAFAPLGSASAAASLETASRETPAAPEPEPVAGAAHAGGAEVEISVADEAFSRQNDAGPDGSTGESAEEEKPKITVPDWLASETNKSPPDHATPEPDGGPAPAANGADVTPAALNGAAAQSAPAATSDPLPAPFVPKTTAVDEAEIVIVRESDDRGSQPSELIGATADNAKDHGGLVGRITRAIRKG